MNTLRSGTLTKSLVLFTIVLALAACGRRGPLQAPDAATPTLDGETKTADGGAVGEEKPDRPFILDGLLF